MAPNRSTGSNPEMQQETPSSSTIKLYIPVPVIVLTCPGQIRASILESSLSKTALSAAGIVLFNVRIKKLFIFSLSAWLTAAAIVGVVVSNPILINTKLLSVSSLACFKQSLAE